MNRIAFIAGKLISKSPYMIGCGANDRTDSDVLLGSDGKPYIPGTTLCGICRHYVEDINTGVFDVNEIFGYTKDNIDEGQNSLITFNDCFLTCKSETDPNIRISPRDGVRLNMDKTAESGGKFDYEIVEAGCEFDLRLEIDLLKYKKTDIDYKLLINTLIEGFNNGEIRVGAKSTRGFGLFELQDVRCMNLDLSKPEGDKREGFDISGCRDMQRYIDFDWNAPRDSDNGWETFSASDGMSRLYETLKIEFSLQSFLFIRNYVTLATTANEDGERKAVDAEQLLNKDRCPVIPGPSWAGAFKAQFVKILSGAGYSDSARLAREVFGFVDEGKNGGMARSKIIFSESVLENSWQLNRTRNAIDRFTGGAADRKLFTTRPTYQGNGNLTIKLRKSIQDKELIKSVINACIDDLNEGFLSVGGETATGGGLLKVTKGGNDGWIQ